MLVLSPPLLVASLRQGYNPDPFTVLVMVTGALFIVERRPVPLAVTMLVGALNRESALFLAPLAYAVWAQRPLDRAALGRVLAVAAPAVAAFCALRFAIPTVGREQVPGYGASLIGGRIDVLTEGLRAFLTSRRAGWRSSTGRSGCSRRSRCATSPSPAAGSCSRRCACWR